MRHLHLLGGIGMLLAGPSLAMSSASMTPSRIAGGTTTAANEPRPRFKRSKAQQAKPCKRPNMRHVSKRVKRKHRRAA
jgi:hypothetical protein